MDALHRSVGDVGREHVDQPPVGRWTPGEIYNVVDDEPAPVREWLPALAGAIGAPPPRKVPRWVARLMGEHVVALMCEVRGASNAKARRELDWAPPWTTWREGFAQLGRA